MQKRILVILLLLIWHRQASAQVAKEPVAVLTPNAANFQLYGDVPVSLYTGLPSITVPLYTLQEGQLSLPISLNYHASGFRPDQHPGWTGQNWTLSAGGVINRAVRDLPDEYDDPNVGGYAIKRGYYYTHSFLDVAGWDTKEKILALTTETDRDVNKSVGDTEPDEFTFNFGSYSGKFYMDQKGNWKVQSDKPLKIVLLNEGNPFVPVALPRLNANALPFPLVYGGFSVVTEDGTQYVFGGVPEAIEYSIDFFRQGTDIWTADSWQLTKIIAPDGHQIALNYARDNGSYINQMYVSFNETTFNNRADGGSYLSTFNCTSFGSVLGTIPEAYYRGKLLSPVYLTSIQTTNTTVLLDRGNTTELTYARAVYDYYYNNIWDKQNEFLPYLMDKANCVTYSCDPAALLRKLQWKQLNWVSIVQQGVTQKKFTLGYSSNDLERLTLQTVTESGGDGTAKPPYSFAYNNYSYTSNGTVLNRQAQYLSSRTDHWGFFNDTYAPFDNLANYYNLREPNPSPGVYLSGALKRITYPTGGVTDFTYEPHRYGKQLDVSRQGIQNTATAQLAGGLRIKRISSYSPAKPDSKIEKEYFYVSGYSAATAPGTLAGLPSTGILGGRAQYSINYTLNSYGNSGYTMTNTVFSSQSVLPSSNNGQGSHIGYSQVVEKRSDNSYTRFYYSNFDTEGNHPDDPGYSIQPTRTFYEPYSGREQERGRLTQEEMYTAGDKCVKRHQTEYVAFPQKDAPDAYVRSVSVRSVTICNSSSGSGVEEGTAYRNYTYAYLPVRDSETVYDSNGNNGLTTASTYSYDPSKLLASVSTTDSKGQTHLANYTYPFNLKNPVGIQPPTDREASPEASAIYAMTARNMLNYPIETVTTRNGLLTSATVQTYKWGGSANASILPFKTYSLEVDRPQATPLPPSAYSNTVNGPFVVAGGDARMRLKATASQYDTKGNPVSIVKDGEIISSYVWGYGGTLLTAKISNASRVAPVPGTPSLGNEAGYVGFESGTASAGTDPDEDYWNMPTTANNYVAPVAHTGNFSWHLGAGNGNLNYSPGRAFRPVRQQLRYKFSAWIKTEAGFGEGDGRMVLQLNRQDGSSTGSTPNCYQVSYFGSTNDRWRYVEVVVDLNAAHASLGLPVSATGEQLQVSAYVYNVGNAGLFMDDVRFQPVESLMTTATHAPGTGPTSQSDANGHATYYEYDGLQRLRLVKDWQGNVLKHFEYHYQR